MTPIRQLHPLRPRRLARLFAAAAAVVVLALGVGLVAVNHAREADRRADRIAAQQDEARQDVLAQAGQPGVRLAVLRRDAAAGAVVGYALVRGQQVQVISDGLRANDRSRTTYVLWDVPRERRADLGGRDRGEPRTGPVDADHADRGRRPRPAAELIAVRGSGPLSPPVGRSSAPPDLVSDLVQ